MGCKSVLCSVHTVTHARENLDTYSMLRNCASFVCAHMQKMLCIFIFFSNMFFPTQWGFMPRIFNKKPFQTLWLDNHSRSLPWPYRGFGAPEGVFKTLSSWHTAGRRPCGFVIMRGGGVGDDNVPCS